MGILMAFIAGYVVGGRAGTEGFEEVAAALKSVRDSQEFEDLLKALRSHAGHVLQELGQRLASGDTEPLSMTSILDRARTYVKDATTTAF